jgi:hypothetical protein
MAAELAFAFRNQLADKSAATRRVTFVYGVRNWLRFLDAHARSGAGAASMSDVETGILNAFIVWLNRRPISKGSRHTIWSSFKQLVAWLQRHRPDLVHPELELPFNPFPRKNAEAKPREAFSKAELAAVLAATSTDIDTSWRMFQEGREALARVDCQAIAAATDLRHLKFDELGVLLAVLTDRFGGLVPPLSATQGTEFWRLHRAILNRGGASEVARYLHATPETLVPYMIAIAAQTFANPEALRLMRRDCMRNHVLLEGRVVITWTKGRSSQPQRRSFIRDKSFSVPNLIDRVLALTEPLVPHVPSGARELLFLCGNITGGSRSVGVISQDRMIRQVRSFAKRHGLMGANGKPLALALANLRTTGLTLAHVALGHDVLKTQVLANHASPDTTRRYIDRPVVQAAQAIELGRLQARFVKAIQSGDLSLQSKRDEAPIISAQNATASGFVCADPLAGIAPGQSKGKLCTAWLGCFTCPNAVIPLEADTLARLLRMRDALSEARARLAPERWRLLYAPKLEILERDVLPRFRAAVHADAVERLLTTPPVPPIE